ncbi:MAG: stage V sporulation protein AE [Eubacteriales bacterium]|nr:stage V sporulation protein AE [Eubacteriales bacterium]
MIYLYVFLIGGAFCLIAQLLIDKTKITPANILVLYVCSGVVLTGVGLYGYIKDFASAGATVPLTGFGYTLAMGVREAVDKHGLLGVLMGGLTSTSSGVTAAMVFAVVWAALFKSKDKNI